MCYVTVKSYKYKQNVYIKSCYVGGNGTPTPPYEIGDDYYAHRADEGHEAEEKGRASVGSRQLIELYIVA